MITDIRKDSEDGVLVTRMAKKFIREVKTPADAVMFCTRILVPVDPHVRQSHSWVWGKLPRLELREVIPGTETVGVIILEVFSRVLGITLDIEECAALAAIAKFRDAKRILEIGTFDGTTALNLAANTSPDAQIVTVDLPPNWSGDLSLPTPREFRNVTDRQGVGRRFLNTPYEHKIRQIFGDSAKLNWSELQGPFDMIFIDACHHYNYVKSDTRNALKCARADGGLIIWHDYGYVKGVSDVVDETSEQIKVKTIAGTRLAVGFVGEKPLATDR